MSIPEEDLHDLRKARHLLENPGIAAKITNLLGAPIEKGFELLPDNWSEKVGGATSAALTKAMELATSTLKDNPGEEAWMASHKIAAAASGGVGGFFGVAALALELPISTTIIMRSIADIARSEGECIDAPETKVACIEVFALGGASEADDSSEAGYFAVRIALAKAVTEAAEHLAKKGMLQQGAPALVQLISNVAQRFSVQVSQKAAAQAVPAIGAAGGAVINTIFLDHFQDMARGHFIVRRLESKHGQELIKELYSSLSH